MAVIPSLPTDTVVYTIKDFYMDGDTVVRMLNGSTLNIWGTLFINGNPVGTIGVIPIATQAEAEAGINNTNVMTPLRTNQHLIANIGLYIPTGPIFTTSAKGLVPASGVNIAKFLRGDGIWADPPGGGGGLTQEEADALYVNVAGDTMAGQLITRGLQTTQFGVITPDFSTSELGSLFILADLNVSGETTLDGILYLSVDPTNPMEATTKQYVDGKIAICQPLNADLTDLVSKWTSASTAGPAILDFNEDTDNGINKSSLTAPVALGGDVVNTLPNTSSTIANGTNLLAFSNKTIALGGNTVSGTTAQFNTANTDADFYTTGGTDVAVADGGTGASDAATARTNLGLGSVDNTADTAKPVSTIQQTALDLKADKTYVDGKTWDVAHGGTGVTALTANRLLVSGTSTTSPLVALSGGPTGFVLKGTTGSLPTWYDDNAQTINAQTGTTYTLVLTDKGKLITLSNAAAITLTIPTNASVGFTIGQSLDIVQLGAGQVTVAPAGGVTIVKSMPTLKTRAQYSVLTLIKIATDTWLITGDAAAS